jgi:hypothetical protein
MVKKVRFAERCGGLLCSMRGRWAQIKVAVNKSRWM